MGLNPTLVLSEETKVTHRQYSSSSCFGRMGSYCLHFLIDLKKVRFLFLYIDFVWILNGFFDDEKNLNFDQPVLTVHCEYRLLVHSLLLILSPVR